MYNVSPITSSNGPEAFEKCPEDGKKNLEHPEDTLEMPEDFVEDSISNAINEQYSKSRVNE